MGHPLFSPEPPQQDSLADQGLHVSEPRGPCLELPPELVGMASLRGWDQNEDERSCDHARDRGHLRAQGAPSEDARAKPALPLLHQEGERRQVTLWALGSRVLWAGICPAFPMGLLSKAAGNEVSKKGVGAQPAVSRAGVGWEGGSKEEGRGGQSDG